MLCTWHCTGTHLFILTFSPFDRLWLGENDMAPICIVSSASTCNMYTQTPNERMNELNSRHVVPHTRSETLYLSARTLCEQRKFAWRCVDATVDDDVADDFKIAAIKFYDYASCQNIELFDLLTVFLSAPSREYCDFRKCGEFQERRPNENTTTASNQCIHKMISAFILRVAIATIHSRAKSNKPHSK